MAELKYWLWLDHVRGVTKAEKIKLLESLGSPEEIFFARDTDTERALGRKCPELSDKSMDNVRQTLRKCEEMDLEIITLTDSGYPTRLANIYDPPLVLYVKGKLPRMDDEAAIAVVGTRSCTPYGIVTAEKIAYEAVKCGAVIVTGLARGIDTAAAKGALRAGGKVVGVLGNGLDIVYPRSNRSLYEDVAATGAIITEFPPGTPPEGKNFPIRNRILSGISVGVTLIEAPERSGALITAASALEQGRDVFVVPGNIDAESCRGSNGLLREGAYPAFSGWDIMGTYEDAFPDKVHPADGRRLAALQEDAARSLVEGEMAELAKPRQKKSPAKADNGQRATKKVIDNAPEPGYIDIMVDPEELSLDERSVLEAFSGRMHVDELILATKLPAQAVLSALTMLEIQGCVVQEPGKFYVPRFKFGK